VAALRRWLERGAGLETATVGCHLHLMASHPDTLIARKRGPAEAAESAQRARAVLEAGWPDTCADEALARLDAWLSIPGRGRNPGTTADLVTASLFVALREGIMNLPHDFASSPGGEPP
jgi:triphosphoribosyl-dephospho-CoA synthase